MTLNSAALPCSKIGEIEESNPISPPNSDLFDDQNRHHSFEIFPKNYNDFLIDSNLHQKRFTISNNELKHNLSKFSIKCSFDMSKQFIKTSENKTKIQINTSKKPKIFCKKFVSYQMNKQKKNNSNTSIKNINKNDFNDINDNMKNPSMKNSNDDNEVSNLLSNNNFNDAQIISREKEDFHLDSLPVNGSNILCDSGNNNLNNTAAHNYNVSAISKFDKIYSPPNVYENSNNLFGPKTVRKNSSGLLSQKNDIGNLNRKYSLNKIKKKNIVPFNNINSKNNNQNKFFFPNTKSEDDTKKLNYDCIDEKLSINKSNTKITEDNFNMLKKNFRGSPRKRLISLRICQILKIVKNGSFFNVLRFLDYFDIINLLQTNRKIRNIINKVISDVYYFRIKENLKKYKDFLELLKCSLVYSNIKDTLKIDLVLNIRLTWKKFISDITQQYFFSPYYIQIAYIYNYYQKAKLKKDLITKEDHQKMNKSLKMYDHYTFDLLCEGNQKYFLMEELSLFAKDTTDKILYIQPILPFKINDRGIINLEIYTTNNNFIDPFSIKIILNFYNLENYIKMLKSKEMSNPRICEYEFLSDHWKNIESFPKFANLKNEIESIFKPCFEIKKFYFQNIGVNVIKVILLAIKQGKIVEKKKLRVKILVKDENDYIENEIRKNNLLFERRDVFELRVGDEITYYFTTRLFNK